jgi:DNA-binding transcriptional regulator YiaG
MAQVMAILELAKVSLTTMKSSLKEQFARLGPTRAIDRVQSGSPAVLALRPHPDLRAVRTVSVALALARRGLSMVRAKHAVEEMVEHGHVVVPVPMVENEAVLANELADAGCSAALVSRRDVNVRGLRERLRLTQEQFALRYGFDIDALRNWERGRRKPDLAAQSYFRVIERLPDAAGAAQEEELGVEKPSSGAPSR